MLASTHLFILLRQGHIIHRLLRCRSSQHLVRPARPAGSHLLACPLLLGTLQGWARQGMQLLFPALSILKQTEAERTGAHGRIMEMQLVDSGHMLEVTPAGCCLPPLAHPPGHIARLFLPRMCSRQAQRAGSSDGHRPATPHWCRSSGGPAAAPPTQAEAVQAARRALPPPICCSNGAWRQLFRSAGGAKEDTGYHISCFRQSCHLYMHAIARLRVDGDEDLVRVAFQREGDVVGSTLLSHDAVCSPRGISRP